MDIETFSELFHVESGKLVAGIKSFTALLAKLEPHDTDNGSCPVSPERPRMSKEDLRTGLERLLKEGKNFQEVRPFLDFLTRETQFEEDHPIDNDTPGTVGQFFAPTTPEEQEERKKLMVGLKDLLLEFRKANKSTLMKLLLEFLTNLTVSNAAKTVLGDIFLSIIGSLIVEPLTGLDQFGALDVRIAACSLFNLLCYGSNNVVKFQAQPKCDLIVNGMAKMLLDTEDYGFQLSLIEASFRLFRKNPTLPKEERDLALKWKKEGWDLAISREYLKISGKPDGFDASLREFLTFLNNRVGKIISLRVTEEAEVFWVHFGSELAVVRSADTEFQSDYRVIFNELVTLSVDEAKCEFRMQGAKDKEETVFSYEKEDHMKLIKALSRQKHLASLLGKQAIPLPPTSPTPDQNGGKRKAVGFEEEEGGAVTSPTGKKVRSTAATKTTSPTKQTPPRPVTTPAKVKAAPRKRGAAAGVTPAAPKAAPTKKAATSRRASASRATDTTIASLISHIAPPRAHSTGSLPTWDELGDLGGGGDHEEERMEDETEGGLGGMHRSLFGGLLLPSNTNGGRHHSTGASTSAASASALAAFSSDLSHLRAERDRDRDSQTGASPSQGDTEEIGAMVKMITNVIEKKIGTNKKLAAMAKETWTKLEGRMKQMQVEQQQRKDEVLKALSERFEEVEAEVQEQNKRVKMAYDKFKSEMESQNKLNKQVDDFKKTVFEELTRLENKQKLDMEDLRKEMTQGTKVLQQQFEKCNQEKVRVKHMVSLMQKQIEQM